MKNKYPLTSTEWIAFAWRWALWAAICVGWLLFSYVTMVNGGPMVKLLGLIFGIGAGIAGLCLSGLVMKRSVWLNSHGEIAEGYITSVRFNIVGTLWPIFVNYRYNYTYNIDGKEYEEWHPYCRFFWRPRIHEGDLVEVIYDPRNPKIRKIKRIKWRNI